MNEVIGVSVLVTLGYAMVALILIRVVLSGFDRIVGLNFKEAIRGISNEPLAMALYLGLRFLGVCLLVSSLFS